MAKLLETILYPIIIQECVMSVNPYKKQTECISLFQIVDKGLK